jgi:8-oxo-dGTP pyrophosphatase MutT (NUDIX family)
VTERPGPGEELRTEGPPTTPRQAATVILLRGGSERLEVLLVKRNPEQRFMGGAWVFPGGAVDAGEGEGDAAHRAAGVREVAEEAGLDLGGPDELVRFSRWITPAMVKIRYDTHFFLAAVPDGAEARADGSECVDLGWFTPQGAIDAYERGEILLVFATIKTLEQLGRFATADELLEFASGREVEPVEPQVIPDGPTARIVLPGEPGYVTSPKASGDEGARSPGRRNPCP